MAQRTLSTPPEFLKFEDLLASKKAMASKSRGKDKQSYNQEISLCQTLVERLQSLRQLRHGHVDFSKGLAQATVESEVQFIRPFIAPIYDEAVLLLTHLMSERTPSKQTLASMQLIAAIVQNTIDIASENPEKRASARMRLAQHQQQIKPQFNKTRGPWLRFKAAVFALLGVQTLMFDFSRKANATTNLYFASAVACWREHKKLKRAPSAMASAVSDVLYQGEFSSKLFLNQSLEQLTRQLDIHKGSGHSPNYTNHIAKLQKAFNDKFISYINANNRSKIEQSVAAQIAHLALKLLTCSQPAEEKRIIEQLHQLYDQASTFYPPEWGNIKSIVETIMVEHGKQSKVYASFEKGRDALHSVVEDALANIRADEKTKSKEMRVAATAMFKHVRKVPEKDTPYVKLVQAIDTAAAKTMEQYQHRAIPHADVQLMGRLYAEASRVLLEPAHRSQAITRLKAVYEEMGSRNPMDWGDLKNAVSNLVEHHGKGRPVISAHRREYPRKK